MDEPQQARSDSGEGQKPEIQLNSHEPPHRLSSRTRATLATTASRDKSPSPELREGKKKPDEKRKLSKSDKAKNPKPDKKPAKEKLEEEPQEDLPSFENAASEPAETKTDPGDRAPVTKPKTRGSRTQSALISGLNAFGLYKKTNEDKGKKKKTRASHHVAPTMKDLPLRAQALIAESKIKKKQFEPVYYELLMVLSFITKDSYRMDPDVRLIKRSEKTKYASKEMQEKAAMAMVAVSEKEVKKKLKRIEFSAKGGFGRVFSARYTTPDGVVSVAIKRLPNVTEKDITSNLCELAFLMHCTNHPNIVNYKECFKIGEEIWIVTEFLEGGTLDFASKVHRFREQHIAFIAGEILNGLAYLHDQNFAHRDLKPSNVMMSVQGDVKLIDFGLCCDFHNGPRQQTLGSPFWIPPEMLLRKPHTISADIWSFSILLLELVIGRTPHHHSRLASMMYSVMGLTLKEALRENYHRALKDPSKELLHFLDIVVVTDHTQRLTSRELLQDPWLKNHIQAKNGIEKVLHAVFVSSSLHQHGMV